MLYFTTNLTLNFSVAASPPALSTTALTEELMGQGTESTQKELPGLNRHQPNVSLTRAHQMAGPGTSHNLIPWCWYLSVCYRRPWLFARELQKWNSGSKMSQELAFHSTLLIQLQLSSSQFSGTLFLHSRAHSSQHQSVKKELRSPNQQLVAGLTQTVQAALHFGFDPVQFLHLGRSYTSTRWTQWSLWSSSIFYDSWYSFYVCFYSSP